MVCEYIKALKAEKGITSQQLSDISGVPISTVNRVLSGQTDNPNFQTVLDMVVALEGSLDALAGLIPAAPQAQASQDSEASLKAILALYERELANKNKWIHVLCCICCILVSVFLAIILYLVWDVTHPEAGIFKH